MEDEWNDMALRGLPVVPEEVPEEDLLPPVTLRVMGKKLSTTGESP